MKLNPAALYASLKLHLHLQECKSILISLPCVYSWAYLIICREKNLMFLDKGNSFKQHSRGFSALVYHLFIEHMLNF